MNNVCSPTRQGDWTCFTVQELFALCDAWNNLHSTDKINTKYLLEHSRVSELCNVLNGYIKDYNGTTQDPPIQLIEFVDTKKYTYDILQKKFFPICGLKNESCWIENSDIKTKLRELHPELSQVIDKFVFKPKGTREQYGWLSTRNIVDVMRQYEKLHDNFKFIDCVPSDYYILEPNKFPLDVLYKYKYLAVVFNLDETHESGSHWVTVFFENSLVNNKHTLYIEYFDSTGNKPIKNIKKFMHNTKLKNTKNKKYLVNTVKHQKGNSECGVFALFYIQQRLNGASFQDFQKERLSDELMNKYRRDFFRPYSGF